MFLCWQRAGWLPDYGGQDGQGQLQVSSLIQIHFILIFSVFKVYRLSLPSYSTLLKNAEVENYATQ
jgi:hypothetical protein